jgi:hypothetical protein
MKYKVPRKFALISTSSRTVNEVVSKLVNLWTTTNIVPSHLWENFFLCKLFRRDKRNMRVDRLSKIKCPRRTFYCRLEGADSLSSKKFRINRLQIDQKLLHEFILFLMIIYTATTQNISVGYVDRSSCWNLFNLSF